MKLQENWMHISCHAKGATACVHFVAKFLLTKLHLFTILFLMNSWLEMRDQGKNNKIESIFEISVAFLRTMHRRIPA
jgi:hypothetical protein